MSPMRKTLLKVNRLFKPFLTTFLETTCDPTPPVRRPAP